MNIKSQPWIVVIGCLLWAAASACSSSDDVSEEGASPEMGDEESLDTTSENTSDNGSFSDNYGNLSNNLSNNFADSDLGDDELINNSSTNNNFGNLGNNFSNLNANGEYGLGENIMSNGLDADLNQVFDPNAAQATETGSLNLNNPLANILPNEVPAEEGGVAITNVAPPNNVPAFGDFPLNGVAVNETAVNETAVNDSFAANSGWNTNYSSTGETPTEIEQPPPPPPVVEQPPWRRELTPEELEDYKSAAARLQDLAQGEGPFEYIVQPGDTLWDISHQFVDDAYWWPKLWAINETEIPNPHQISPGMKILFFPGASPFGPVTQVADLGEVYPIANNSLSVTRMPLGEGFQGDDIELLESGSLPDDPEVSAEGSMVIPSAYTMMLPGFMQSEWPDQVGEIIRIAKPSVMGVIGDELLAELDSDIQPGQKLLAVRETDAGCDPNGDCDTDSLDHFTITGVVGVSKVADDGRAILVMEDTRQSVLMGDILIPYRQVYVNVNPNTGSRIAQVEARVIAMGQEFQEVATTMGDVLYLVVEGEGSANPGDDLAIYMPRGEHIEFDWDLMGGVQVARARVIEVNDECITAVLVAATRGITVGARTWNEF